MSNVQELLTNRFLNLYGAPETHDPVAFAIEYTKALAGTDPDLLSEAADRVIRAHKYRNWPTVGECVEAVREVGEARMMARRREAWGYGPEKRIEPTADEKARVAEMAARVKKALATTIKPIGRQLRATDLEAWDTMLATSETARHFAGRTPK